METNLLKLYIPLITWIGLGLLMGFKLPKAIPFYLGKSLFWVGVPLSIVTFLRQADLSQSVWVAPAVAWVAIGLGASLGWLWLKGQRVTPGQPSQGSFLLAAMVGNTGYMGYPVILTLVGAKYFAWAVFYDTLGSTLGAYGLGAALAARLGRGNQTQRQLLLAIFINPALWSFWFGLCFRSVSLPFAIEQALRIAAWTVIALSLLLLGMRLSQIASWRSVRQASIALSLKMLIVPLILGMCLYKMGITGVPHLVLVLQMGMPPAFATLILAEAYDLDRELTVTALAIGSIALLAMIPVWLWLFAPS